MVQFIPKRSHSVAPTQQQLLLYGTLGITLTLLILGMLVAVRIWQIQDIGIIADGDTGIIQVVLPNSPAAQAGIVVGDYISPLDYDNLIQQLAQDPLIRSVRVPIVHGGQMHILAVATHPAELSRRVDRSVETWVGLAFVFLGTAPLLARRRKQGLWLFYWSSTVIGIVLIISGAGRLWLPLTKPTYQIAFSLFPAILFHFHTYFPVIAPSRYRMLVPFVYLATTLISIVIIINQFGEIISPNVFLLPYVAIILIACLFLLLRAFIRSSSADIRRQIRVILGCSFIGMGLPALLLLPATLYSTQIQALLFHVPTVAALAIPIGYSYAILHHNFLIGELLWRPWLLRATWSSLLFTIWVVSLFLLHIPLDSNNFLLSWGFIIPSTVLIGFAIDRGGDLIEYKVSQGRTDIDLLDYATRQLESFHNLDEFVHFLTTALPHRLRSNGCLVFLATTPGSLVLRGTSSTLSILNKNEVRSIDPASQLSLMIQDAHHVIPIDAIAADTSFSPSDHRLLALFRAAHIALLLPLVSNQQSSLIGLVAVGARETDEPYSLQESTALSALARTASASAQNVLLFDNLQQKIQALSEEREDRLALARQVKIEQEAVRKRISRDLHDRPVQELSVLKRALTALREDVEGWIAEFEDQSFRLGKNGNSFTAQSLLELLLTEQRRLEILLGEDVSLLANVSLEKQPTVEGLISQAATTLTMLRGICDDLHPGFLSGSLRNILGDSLVRLKNRYSQISFVWKVQDEEADWIPDGVKEACKEIMDQAIHNAVVHGSATKIEVELKQISDSILLTIIDNGKGFIPGVPRQLRTIGHHGIANMTERAELVGGELLITSAIGQGTQVQADFQRSAIPTALMSEYLLS